MEGLRRYSGTELGDQYRRVLAFGADENPGDPRTYERTLGDLLDPLRPGRVVDIVNAVTRETGVDAEGWRIDRLLSMVAGLEADAAARGE